MCLDGMSGGPLRLRDEDKAGGEDHAEGSPLDGVEDPGEWSAEERGLTEEGEEELDDSGGGESQRDGAAGACAMSELLEEHEVEGNGESGGVERDGMEAGEAGGGWDGPGDRGDHAGVAAFGEMSDGEEGPDEGGAGCPGVERVEDGEATPTEVDRGDEDGEEDSEWRERGDSEEQERVGEEGVEVGEDQKEAREDEGGEQGEEAGVKEAVGIESCELRRAQAEHEGRDESDGGEEAEGGDDKIAEVEEGGVH